MINGSLLPLFFNEDVPPLGLRGDYFAQTFFTDDYFESQYFVRVREISPYADIVDFALEINRFGELSLQIQTQLEQELSINRQLNDTLIIDKQIEFTVER
jgi:hypothetical protein